MAASDRPVALVEGAFRIASRGARQRPRSAGTWQVRCARPVPVSDDPQEIVARLVDAIGNGCSAVELAGLGRLRVRAADRPVSDQQRIPRLDTALHSFTFANAVQQALRRSESPELLRGVFDAAMSVYLNRFSQRPRSSHPGSGRRRRQPRGVAAAPCGTSRSAPRGQCGRAARRRLPFGRR